MRQCLASFVTRCASTNVFEFVDEAFDEVAARSRGRNRMATVLPAGMGKDDRGDSPAGECLDERIGVAGLVANQCPRIGAIEQRLCAEDRWLVLAKASTPQDRPTDRRARYPLVLNAARDRPIACAPFFSTHGVDGSARSRRRSSTIFTRQQLENALENPALGPQVEELNRPPVPEIIGRIAPRDIRSIGTAPSRRTIDFGRVPTTCPRVRVETP